MATKDLLTALLDATELEFEAEKQWASGDTYEEMKARARAEGYIRIIEVWDCGSHGGFGQGYEPKGDSNLERRFAYLKKKYQKQTSIP